MKNTLRYLALATAGVLLFSGCSKEDAEPAAPKTVTKTISFTSEKPELNEPTRTVYKDGSILWNKTGEQIRMGYSIDGAFTNKNVYTSEEGTISGDQKIATFTVSSEFSGSAAGEYQFYAIYPSTAVEIDYNGYLPSITVVVPTTQSPADASFDPAADVMLGVSQQTYQEIPSEAVPLFYKRVVAHGCVTLTGLKAQEGETLKSISFAAPEGTAIAGKTFMNLTTREITETGEASNKVSLQYTNVAANVASIEAWFCAIPFTVEANSELTVTVTTSRGTYTRAIAAKADGIVFKEGKRNTLKIAMDNADFKEAAVTKSYILLTKVDEVYYALASTNNISSSRLDAIEYIYNGAPSIVSTQEELVWNIAENGSSYTMENGGLYLSTSAKNSAKMVADPYDLTFTTKNGATVIATTENKKNYLVKNGKYMAFYTTMGASEFLLIPAEFDNRTPLETPANVEASAEGKDITVSWDAVTGAANYTVTCGAQTQTVDATIAEFTMDFNTAYDISIVANPADTQQFASSIAATASATTEADPDAKEATVTFDFTAGDNSLTRTENGISYKFEKAGGKTQPLIKDDHIRLYGGGTLTVESEDPLITKIEYEYVIGKGENVFSTNIGTWEAPIWTGSARSIILTESGTSGNYQFSKITVYYLK